MTKYEIHPAAELFPMMTDIEFKGLKADIEKHGQRDDIMIWRGQLVDGRNRLRACNELGIEPSLCEMSEELDPVDWVLSHNLHRRHLDTAQRAMVAERLATLRHGEAGNGRKIDSSIELSTQAKAAEKLNVSVSSVKKARKVRAKAAPEVVAAVEAGTMSLNAAEATTKTKASQAEREAAKAAKEKAKAEAAAEKLRAKLEAAGARQKLKDDAAEAKAEAKALKERAKAEALTTEGQAKAICNLIQQHIDKAVRLVDDLAHLRPVSNAGKMAVIKALQGIKLW
jgi:ParB-like chromosome segregation protein Spo0J